MRLSWLATAASFAALVFGFSQNTSAQGCGDLDWAASITVVQHEQCDGDDNGKLKAVHTNDSTGTYVWSTGATTQIISGLADGTYSVTVTSSGCTDRDTTTVNAGNTLSITLRDDTTMCAGASVNVYSSSVTGTPTLYKWNSGQGSDTISVTAAGTYTLTVTDANGCTASDDAVVSVTAISGNTDTLTFTANGKDTTVCSGTTYLVATRLTSPGNYTYEWQNGHVNDSIWISGGDTYQVTATLSSTGCQSTGSFTVTDSTGGTNQAVSGTVIKDNGGTTVTWGEMRLFDRDPTDGSYSYLMDVAIQADGTYNFPNVFAGSYKMQFFNDENVDASLNSTTYIVAGSAGGDAQNDGDSLVYTCSASASVGAVVIDNVVPKKGSSKISGTITSGSGKNATQGVDSMHVYLVDPVTREMLAGSKKMTSYDGKYSFKDIAAGTYMVYMTQMNYFHADNFAVVTVPENGEAEINFEVVDFDIHTTDISGVAVGVGENIDNSKVTIYPNPSSNLNVSAGSAINLVEVVDMQGRVVVAQQGNMAQVQLNGDNLVAGPYLVRVTTDNSVSIHKWNKQ